MSYKIRTCLMNGMIWISLLFVSINCSRNENYNFTYTQTLILNSFQADIPNEFIMNKDNQWSFEDGIKRAKILFNASSLIDQQHDVIKQFILSSYNRGFKYLSSDSSFNGEKKIWVYTYSKESLLGENPPITGISYLTIADIIFKEFEIKIESESNGFDMESTIMKIAKSIKITKVEVEVENVDKREDEQFISTPVDENPDNKFSGKDISDREVMKEYLITEKSVGYLGKRGVMPGIDSFDDYAIRTEARKFKFCDDFDVTVLIFSRDGIDEFYAVRDEEFLKKNNQARVNEFYILSDKFKTKEKIGVGSTIEDFINVYPEYELIGNCGRLLAKRKDSWVFFYFDRNDYVGNKEISRPVVKLELRDIRPKAQIVEIKI